MRLFTAALLVTKVNAQLALVSTKYAMIVSSELCLMPVFLLKPFLWLWVGNSYSEEYLGHLAFAGAILLVGQWVISTAVCILQMLTGVGKIKIPAVVTLSWALGGLACIWMYVHWVRDSLLAVVIGISIARVAGSVIHFIYGMIILNLHKGKLLQQAVIKPAIAGVLTCSASLLSIRYTDLYNMGCFIATVLTLCVVYGIVSWYIVLTKTERSSAIEHIGQAMRKFSIGRKV